MCSRKQARLVVRELPCLGKLVCMYGSCFKFPAACPYQNSTWVTSLQMMAALLSVVIWMRCQISQDPTSVQNVVSPKCRFPTWCTSILKSKTCCPGCLTVQCGPSAINIYRNLKPNWRRKQKVRLKTGWSALPPVAGSSRWQTSDDW